MRCDGLPVDKKRFVYNLSVYLIAYGVFRFAIEYLRDDHRGALVAGMSPSQFWSVCMVVIGILLVFVFKRMGIGASEPVEMEDEENDEDIE